MASPQTENGFTRIANEIVDALARTHLSGRQSQILWAIFRRTYGYQQKEAVISFDMLAEMTGCKDRRHLAGDINALERRGIIVVKRHATGNTYAFQKDYERWDEQASIAEIGNTPTEVSIAENGNTSIAEIGNASIAEIGNYKRKKEKKENMRAGNFLPDAETQAAILFAGRRSDNGHQQGEQALARAGWEIGNRDLHDAVVYFVAATDIPVPRVRSTRRDWLAAVSEHVEEYGAAALKELYPEAVRQLRERGIRVGRPGALTKTLPVVAHALAHPEKPKAYEL